MSSPPPGSPKRDDKFEQLVRDYFQMFLNHNDTEFWGIDASRSSLRLEFATRDPQPRASYLLTVTQNLCNLMGNLHGGCAATIIDILTSTVLIAMSKPGIFTSGGVSRNLKVTYLRPVPEGTEARVICEVVHIGRRLAYLRAEIRRADTGALCMIGEHEKANTDDPQEKI
ncbi:hypothetical protein MAP00_001565 [Monascus purpureus]|nr:hypothetical protein MAP00_001565 [Monascus purpureus]